MARLLADFIPLARGRVFPDEDGVPDCICRCWLRRLDTATATTAANGTFKFDGVGSGNYRVQIDASNFHQASAASSFGTQSLTPTGSLSPTMQAILSLPIVDIAMIIGYLWIWAGFAMVVIGAGLAALNREVLEAAQIDGPVSGRPCAG